VTPRSRLPEGAVVGLREREDGMRIEPYPGATPGGRRWASADWRRPRVVGRFEGTETGTEELEVEVPRGETIGSALLVSGDGSVVRLAFREVGSTPERWPRPTVRVAIERLAAPPGIYDLILATRFGVPSAGELVVIGEWGATGEEEGPGAAQGSAARPGEDPARAEWPPQTGR
jgi:hypothetical protein